MSKGDDDDDEKFEDRRRDGPVVPLKRPVIGRFLLCELSSIQFAAFDTLPEPFDVGDDKSRASIRCRCDKAGTADDLVERPNECVEVVNTSWSSGMVSNKPCADDEYDDDSDRPRTSVEEVEESEGSGSSLITAVAAA